MWVWIFVYMYFNKVRYCLLYSSHCQTWFCMPHIRKTSGYLGLCCVPPEVVQKVGLFPCAIFSSQITREKRYTLNLYVRNCSVYVYYAVYKKLGAECQVCFLARARWNEEEVTTIIFTWSNHRTLCINWKNTRCPVIGRYVKKVSPSVYCSEGLNLTQRWGDCPIPQD